MPLIYSKKLKSRKGHWAKRLLPQSKDILREGTMLFTSPESHSQEKALSSSVTTEGARKENIGLVLCCPAGLEWAHTPPKVCFFKFIIQGGKSRPPAPLLLFI